jgi:hypothetical protein
MAKGIPCHEHIPKNVKMKLEEKAICRRSGRKAPKTVPGRVWSMARA